MPTPVLHQSIGFKLEMISLRYASREGGSTTFSPSVAGSSSTATLHHPLRSPTTPRSATDVQAAEPEAVDLAAIMQRFGHEQVVFIQDPKTGLRGIIAIHSTVLGPALGGTRMYPYASEADALRDVLELSRGMTYKAATAGLNLGGGKAVIIGDPRTDKSDALLRAFGRFVNRLNGLFYTGEDVGTDVRDLETVAKETAYVGGLAREHGGGGDPSPVTAYGVFQGMKAVLPNAGALLRFAADVSRCRDWAKSGGI